MPQEGDSISAREAHKQKARSRHGWRSHQILGVFCHIPFVSLRTKRHGGRPNDGPGRGRQVLGGIMKVEKRLANRPGPPGRLSARSIFLSKSVFYGAFVWARGALNRQKRRFPARAVRENAEAGFSEA